LALVFSSGFGQKQANFWYFGHKAALDFVNFYPIPLDNSLMDTPEGAASISDAAGKLLFYTDGVNIWDSNGARLNTTNLNGDPSSTQSATIVPDPNTTDQYFVFTTKSFIEGIQENTGVSYYTVKISSGSTGTVSGPVVLAPNTAEKFLAVPFIYETNKTGYWFIMPELNSNRFIEVKFQGQFSSPVYQTVPINLLNDPIEYGKMRCQAGQIKVNDRGDRIALAVEGGKFFEVLRFDISDGKISNSILIPAGSSWAGNFARQLSAYGVEFSPSGRFGFAPDIGNFLYGTARDSGYVYQWDLSNYDQNDRTQLIKSSKFLSTDPEKPCGAMQMGPNGKIYIAYNGQDFIGVINSPMHPYPDCAFRQKGARLINNDTKSGGLSGFGLPAPVPIKKDPEPFYYENLCEGDETLFYITDQTNIVARAWMIQKLPNGRVLNFAPTTNDFLYKFPSAGNYRVTLVLRKNGVVAPITYPREIMINEVPKVKLTLQDETILCPGDSLILEAGPGAFYKWEDPEIQVRTRTIPSDSVPDKDVGGYRDFRVTVTGYNGCNGWDTVYIAKTKPPTIDSTNSTPAFCHEIDGRGTIFPHGKIENFTYSWELFPLEKTNTIKDVEGGDYKVHVASKIPPFCEVIGIVHVDQIGGRNVKIVSSGGSIVCPGQPDTLTVTGADEVEWVFPPGLTDMKIVVNPTEKTVYSVKTKTWNNGRPCPTDTLITLDVYTVKPPVLKQGPPPCVGDTALIKADSPYISYLWSNGQTDSIAKITENTKLTLTATDLHGCVSVSEPIDVTFNPIPTVNLGQDLLLCATETTLKLISNTQPGDQFLWKNDLGQELGVNQEFTATKSGIYSLRITRAGCSAKDEINVQLRDINQLIISKPVVKDITCFGNNNGTITIDVDNKSDGKVLTYSIDNQLSYSSGNLFKDLKPGTNYKVWVKIDNACAKPWTDPVIIAEPLPLIIKTCIIQPSGENAADGQITVSGEGGTGNYYFELDDKRINNSPSRALTIEGLSNKTGIITMIDANGCKEYRPVVLDSRMQMRIEADKATVCLGESVKLKLIRATGESPVNEIIEWVGFPDQKGDELTVTPKEKTIYQVRSVRDYAEGYRCETNTSIEINVWTVFSATVGKITPNSCFVTQDLLPDGSVEILVEPSGNYSYSLYSESSSLSIDQNSSIFTGLPAATDYLFTIRDEHQCTKEVKDITVIQPNPIEVTYKVYYPNCSDCTDGRIAIKKIEGGNGNTYEITLNGNPVVGNEITNLSIAKRGEPYILKVTDMNGCENLTTIPLDMLNMVPNVLVPNGEHNNYWKIPLLEDAESCEVSVYNLNGIRVYYSSCPYDPWNGTIDNSPAPAGPYFYFINFNKDGKTETRKGTLTILLR
jgi:gliding motility-associated-like protein